METTEKGGQEFMTNWAKYREKRKSLFAPAAIIEDNNLSPHAKILFIIINSFSIKFGNCFAGNEVLSEKVGLKRTMLKKYLNELRENQLIKILHQPSHKFVRRIYVDFDGLNKRYPELQPELPATCRVSDKAAKLLRKRGFKVLQKNILR
jgi:hypothetical protein